MTAKKHAFQAEVSQVLSLVVNSLYSEKEIFLRELVSNSSDALDKLRFEGLKDKSLLEGDTDLKIRLIPNEDAGTLTIEDNGIGMGEQELVDNLGTIARSGTKAFGEKIKEMVEAQKGDTQLIGQFGVGFYSAFLVADRVEVISRAAGSDKAFRWESEAKEDFVVEETERAGRGTTVILHLKDDQKEYANQHTLRQVIRRHSDYVGHPIELETIEKTEAKEGEEAKEETKSEVINQASALWQRNPKEIEDEQYKEFYKHLAHDWTDPLSWKHFRIEGTQMFSGIVFLPASAKADLLDPRGEHGVRLHVRRILAMESCEELLPKWLRFVRGVVDSEDLPLNVSRETIQDSRAVKIIRKQITSQVLAMIEELKEERAEDYAKFWESFGIVLKEGIYFETDMVERLSKLMRFQTSFEGAEGGMTDLGGYVARMKDEQPGIYFVEGESKEILAQSPHLEKLLSKGFEVLYMTDGVDPFALEKLKEFESKPLLNAMSDDLDLGDGEKAETDEDDKFTEAFKEILGDRVSAVRNSTRLSGSPACLVTPAGGIAPHMEAMFKAQGVEVPKTARILELNSEHDIVKNLRSLQLTKPDAPELKNWMQLLHDQALIAEGSQVDDPTGLASRLTEVLGRATQQATES